MMLKVAFALAETPEGGCLSSPDLGTANWTILGLEFSPTNPGWKKRTTMRASRFSDAQKAFILKQRHGGVAVTEICRKVGSERGTYSTGTKRVTAADDRMRRLKKLEHENAKLKKLAADLSLDKEMLQDGDAPKVMKAGLKRKPVDEVCGEWEVSIRMACEALEFDRSIKLQVSSLRQGSPRRSDRGDTPCSRSLRLSPWPRSDAPRGVAPRPEQDTSHLPRIELTLPQAEPSV